MRSPRRASKGPKMLSPEKKTTGSSSMSSPEKDDIVRVDSRVYDQYELLNTYCHDEVHSEVGSDKDYEHWIRCNCWIEKTTRKYKGGKDEKYEIVENVHKHGEKALAEARACHEHWKLRFYRDTVDGTVGGEFEEIDSDEGDDSREEYGKRSEKRVMTIEGGLK